MSTQTQEKISYLLKNGVAPTNRFQVLIPLPNVLLGQTSNVDQQNSTSFWTSEVFSIISTFVGGSGNEITRGLDLMINATELPGKSLTTSDMKYNGDFYRQAYSIVYSEIPMVFVSSRDLYEKNIIDEWMNQIVDPATYEVQYMDEYAVDITVNQLDMQDKPVYSVVLKDAFPITCNSMPVSNEDTNQVHQVSTSFAYRTWYNAASRPGNGLADSIEQTAMGPILTPILSNPIVQRGLEVLEQTTGIDLEGEALIVYNQIDKIVRNTTGQSINTTIKILNDILGETRHNPTMTGSDRDKLIHIIEQIIISMSK